MLSSGWVCPYLPKSWVETTQNFLVYTHNIQSYRNASIHMQFDMHLKYIHHNVVFLSNSNNAYLSKQQTPLINQSNKIKKYVLHIRTHHLLLLEFLENMSLVPVPQRRRTFLQRHPWIHNYKVYFKVTSLWMLLFEQSHWSSTYKNRTRHDLRGHRFEQIPLN